MFANGVCENAIFSTSCTDAGIVMLANEVPLKAAVFNVTIVFGIIVF